MGIIKRGYSLQFARRPPRFSAVVPTLVVSKDTHVLRSEVMNLLEKGAVEVVHPAQSESGFYSRYFLVPKKDGGLRPILDLRHLNRALMKRPLKMITLRQILSHIRPGDWFFSLDLKDAYFHIQIAPPSQTILEIRLRGSGLSIHGPALRLVPGSLPIRGRAVIPQITSSQPFGMPGTQGQFGQERTASQPTNLVSGSSFRLDPDEGNSQARSSSGNTAARGIIQNWCLSPPQNVSKDARPYGLSIPSAKVRPASYAAPSVLAETMGSISCVASRTFAYQGGPGLCRSPVSLEELAMDGERRAPGYGLQEEGGHDRRFQHRLGSSVRWLTSFRPLDESRSRDSHQLPGDAGSVSSPSLLLARSEGTPCAGPLGQHDGGVLYKSPGGTFLQAPLHSSEGPSGVGSAQPVFTEGNARTRQTNQGADMLSRSNVPSGEWTLHPQAVQKIWEVFGKAEVDLFASEDNSHCPMYYSKDRDALAHNWPNLLLYAFPPDILDSSSTQASQGTETQTPSGGPSLEKPALVLRAVPAARSSPLAHSPETRPPLSGERDNMAPPAQAVGPAPLVSGRESMNLSESVLNTISQARAPSTRRLLSGLSFPPGAQPAAKTQTPVTYRRPASRQEQLGCSILEGIQEVEPSSSPHYPYLGLSTVLRALKGPPFEPLPGSDL
ncbi:Gag-pol polyprotein [Labeo rohita]|uniref:Gag-pol polyprotein n=1 Tax=Labeo rohita TaxID=84645 RepID=A0ABQ8M8M6_LABRO|nr:Gag-pol polyprotein [Labeo rohita]